MTELICERRGAVLVMTLNRPERRNAVNAALARAIADAMLTLDGDDDLRIGVLAGAGETFCSGMDLAAFLAGEPREVEGRGFAGITEAPPAKPLVAAVEGSALAGGCEIMLTCDLIVAARDATFGLPEARRGLIAGSGGLLRLPHRIPPQIALEYALTGEPLPAVEAHRLGLVNRLTEPGGALEEALRLAEAIAANAPLSVRYTKELVRDAVGWPGAELWRRQRGLVAEIVGSDDAQEGAQAFLDKRPPRWRGR